MGLNWIIAMFLKKNNLKMQQDFGPNLHAAAKNPGDLAHELG